MTSIFSSAQAPTCTSSRRAVSVITITRSASSQSDVRTCSWCGVGAESTVCKRHDERLCELAGERQHVFAVSSAEDAVLVLEENDVDVSPTERTRRADVVAARALRDGL